MRGETRRRMRWGDVGLALAERQPGCHEGCGEHMVAMADMMAIIVVTNIGITGQSVGMV